MLRCLCHLFGFKYYINFFLQILNLMINLVKFLSIILVTRPWATTQFADQPAQQRRYSHPLVFCGHRPRPGQKDSFSPLIVFCGHRPCQKDRFSHPNEFCGYQRQPGQQGKYSDLIVSSGHQPCQKDSFSHPNVSYCHQPGQQVNLSRGDCGHRHQPGQQDNLSRPCGYHHQPGQKMSQKPFIILNKGTNKSQRQRNSSQSSENSSDDDYQSCESSPTVSRDSSPVTDSFGGNIKLRDELSSAGGFTSSVNKEGGVKRDIYGFPTKVLKPQEREICVKEFVGKLYNLSGANKDSEVDKILCKIAPSSECKRPHLPEISQARRITQNVAILPDDGFKMPDTVLANSTPGPRVSKVEDIFTPHTPSDSLRIINHLQLSNDDSRYVRSISLVGLSSEHAVNKLRSKLMGNDGKGWVEAEKVTFRKWFRKKTNEIKNSKNGQPAKKEVVIGRIPKSNLQSAIQHWADVISDSGEYRDMQDMEFCPEVLRDCVVVVVGNDSGQGYCREGLRFYNRVNANSGSKVFVTTVMEGTDPCLFFKSNRCSLL